MEDKNYVSYHLAVALKNLGFDIDGISGYYNPEDGGNSTIYSPNRVTRSHFVAAPTWQQAFDWFTETHKLFPEFTLWGDGLGYICIIKEIRQEEFLEVYSLEPVDMGLSTYDIHKVRPLALKTLIRIVKERK